VLHVWAALSDEALQKRLLYYLWLSTVTPGAYEKRLQQLTAEIERRGKPEMLEKARHWLAHHDSAPPRL